MLLDLSIIIPAYNEENRIKNTLLSVRDFVEESGLKVEIIVVDDGSKDGMIGVVEHQIKKIPYLRMVQLAVNHGKGHAVKVGVEEARGELVLFTDADNSTPIEECLNLMKVMKDTGADVAIGSRYLRKNSVKIKQSRMRVLLGRLGNILIGWLLVKGIRDTQCGFKLFKAAVAKDIFAAVKIERWGFDMEVLAIAKLRHYQVVEVPVDWFNSSESRLRPVRDALKTFGELLRIKWNLMLGKYR